MRDSKYFIASGLVGFTSDSLRVRLVRDFGNGKDVLVMTASLLDAGTTLLLNWSQLKPFEETVEVGMIHRNGLVILGGAA